MCFNTFIFYMRQPKPKEVSGFAQGCWHVKGKVSHWVPLATLSYLRKPQTQNPNGDSGQSQVSESGWSKWFWLFRKPNWSPLILQRQLIVHEIFLLFNWLSSMHNVLFIFHSLFLFVFKHTKWFVTQDLQTHISPECSSLFVYFLTKRLYREHQSQRIKTASLF